MKPSERSKDVASLFLVTVSVVGLMIFAYSGCALALRPINFEWILLSLVTILMVSRIDIGIHKGRSAVTLSDTFIFISMLLYGTHASVVLAGLDAAVCALLFRERRRMILFNGAAMSMSIFAASSTVTLSFGELRPLASEPGRLVLAAGMLALIHLVLISGTMSLASAQKTARSFIDSWKGSFLWTSLSVLAGAASACLIV